MNETEASYFESVANRWDEMRSGFFSDTVCDKALDEAGVRSGQRAVDVGAGTGFVTKGLIDRGLRVIAVDPSRAMLSELEKKWKISAGIECREGRAEKLPVGDEEVDYVFANMALHHVNSPPEALKEMSRILKPGGKVVITDLDEHDYEFLRVEHHDLWMGFRRADITRWLAEVGFGDASVKSLNETCSAVSDCGSEKASVSIFIAIAVKNKNATSDTRKQQIPN
jgi:ubiquinone/menaquinone biosynthesis C-methylase UbiE